MSIFGAAGEWAGQYRLDNWYENPKARARALDARRAVAGNPMPKAMNDANPAAALLSRTWLHTVDPDAPIPPVRFLSVSFVLAITPGRAADALMAIAQADDTARRLGAEPWEFMLTAAGSATGQRVRRFGWDSFEAYQDFGDRLAADRGERLGPIQQAVADGALTTVRNTLSTTIDL